MDIAAMSTSMSSVKVQQQVSISMMKKTMETVENNALAQIEKMMPKTTVATGEVGKYINKLI